MTDQKTSATGSEEGLSYEQARAELASVVERLEAGGTSLEDSLALWERGERLAAVCQRWLDGARERIETARRERDTAAGNGPEPAA
ncbi:exodeoxyribonuclease VII small subunit [Micromonospora sp. NPDC049559]|uniref:exodeoxyribonuclease VII small subunit n=1 Tax=Micromonospora sp. NPDC049559 TaxID=3155923 RepID=UPI0034492B23